MCSIKANIYRRMSFLLKMENHVFLVIVSLLYLPNFATGSDYIPTLDPDPPPAVFHQQAVMWSELAPDNRIQVVEIAGNPEEWIESHSPRIIGEDPNPQNKLLYSSRIALGFLYAKQELYWSDIGFKEIHKVKLERKDPAVDGQVPDLNKTVQVIYTGTSQEVNGLAVDWLSGSVYWTDALYNWITVASGRNKDHYRQLVLTGLDKPMGLVLHPLKGMMYWSDWGAVPKIESATLAGDRRKTLIDTSLDRPLGLVIDYSTNELFWVDDFLDTIDVLNLDTGVRRAFKSNAGNRPGPASYFGLTLHQNYIFVTDQLRKIIQVFNRTSSEHIQDVFLGRVPYDIIMYDESQQMQIGSECDILGCQHMCVSTGHGKGRCLCAYGYTLSSDNKTCIESGGIRDPMFVYTIGKSVCATPVNVPDREFVDLNKDVRCFINGTGNAMAMAADVNGDSLFYSDHTKGTVSRARLTLETRMDTITRQTGEVRGIAVDWLSSNLYYTDASFGLIMISRLEGRYPNILCEDIGSPAGITLNPAEGKMYWADRATQQIWAANMDCSNRKSLVQRAVGVDGLAIDLHEKRLYWAQESGVISVALDGSDKKTLIDDYRHTYKDVAIYQEYFAWSDGRNGIFFGEKATGRTLRGFRHLETNVSHDILGFSMYLQPASEGGCDVQNGGCQQLCIPLPSSYTCRCAFGFTLADDKKHCESNLVRGRFLLMADPYHKQVYQVDLEKEELEPQGMGLSTPEYPSVIDMDTVNEVIYWGDEKAGVIKSRSLLDAGTERNVLDLGINQTVTSLVVDGLSGQIVFSLTDKGTGLSVMHSSPVDGSIDKVTETIGVGGKMALDERKGLLYWSKRTEGGKWTIQKREIRSQLQNTEIVLDDLEEIIDIAISYSDNQIYWCNNNRIWSAHVLGMNVKEIFRNNNVTIVGMAVVEDHIYLTLMNNKSLFRLDVSTSRFEPVTKPLFAEISDIKEYWRLPPKALPPPPEIPSDFDPSVNVVQPNRNATEEAGTPVERFLGSHVPMPIVIGVVAGNLVLIILIIVVVCAIRKCRKKPDQPKLDYGGPSHENPTYVTTELAMVENLYEGLPGATSGNQNRMSRDSDLPDIVTDKDGLPLEDMKAQAAPPLPSPRTPSDQAEALPEKSVLASPAAAGIGGMNNFFFPSDERKLVVNLPEEDDGQDNTQQNES